VRYSINIERVDNGYTLTPHPDCEGGRWVVEDIEDDSEVKSEQLTMKQLLHQVINFFNVNNDKHNEQYLEVKVSNE